MKLLDFGSLNIDDVYTLHHIIRPGETLSSDSYHKNEGGKGLNQAVALAKAGQPVYMAGAIGEDGLFLKQYLEENGVFTDHLQVLPTPTGHAMIMVDESGQNSIVLYGGSNRAVTQEMIDGILQHFSEGDVLLLQNEISELSYLIRSAKARGMTVVLNPSPISESLKIGPLNLVDWLILNEIEGADLTGETEPDAILNRLLSIYPACRIVLTLGSEGACYADAHRRVFQPAFPVEPVDTTAAGDTFTGYFLHSILNGASVEAALIRASKAASVAVTRPGAGRSIPVSREIDL